MRETKQSFYVFLWKMRCEDVDGSLCSCPEFSSIFSLQAAFEKLSKVFVKPLRPTVVAGWKF